MNKQKNYRRRQRGITPITTPRNSPGVAQFSMSEVAQFSMSLDILFILKPFSTQTTDHSEPTDRTASVSAEPTFVGLNARFSTG